MARAAATHAIGKRAFLDIRTGRFCLEISSPSTLNHSRKQSISKVTRTGGKLVRRGGSQQSASTQSVGGKIFIAGCGLDGSRCDEVCRRADVEEMKVEDNVVSA